MSDVDSYVRVCDPLPEHGAGTASWRSAIRGIARVILDGRQLSPWEIGEALAQVAARGRLGPDRFSARAGAAIAKALPDSAGCDALLGAVCVMAGATSVVANRRLRAERKKARRDSIALAVWSALSFQRPLTERWFEEARRDLLSSARSCGSEAGRRRRRKVNRAGSPDDQNAALRCNATLDQEENQVLRWTLAGSSDLLEQPYAEVGCEEVLALVRGLDLGLLLARPPVVGHYRLASRDIAAPGHSLDLDGLLTAVGVRRTVIAAPFKGSPLIDTYPSVFPLLAALSGNRVARTGAAVERSLRDWCGRALLESSMVRHSQRNSEDG